MKGERDDEYDEFLAGILTGKIGPEDDPRRVEETVPERQIKPLLAKFDEGVESARIDRILDECLPPPEVEEVIGHRTFYKHDFHRQSRSVERLAYGLKMFGNALAHPEFMSGTVESYMQEECKNFIRSGRLYVQKSEIEYVTDLVNTVFNKYLEDVIKESGYTGEPPSSPADDTSQQGMADDFNTELAVSRYELLARRVDLLNPELSEAVKETRANRLARAYTRLRKLKPDFEDKGEQMQAANRIRMAAFRRRKPKEADI